MPWDVEKSFDFNTTPDDAIHISPAYPDYTIMEYYEQLEINGHSFNHVYKMYEKVSLSFYDTLYYNTKYGILRLQSSRGNFDYVISEYHRNNQNILK